MELYIVQKDQTLVYFWFRPHLCFFSPLDFFKKSETGVFILQRESTKRGKTTWEKGGRKRCGLIIHLWYGVVW